METTCYEVRGTLDGEVVVVRIVDYSSSQALWTTRELWPAMRIHTVGREPEWTHE